MKYDLGTGEFKNWIVAEEKFCPDNPGKCEAIFALGNGYMGMRSATEETYLNTTRDFFVAGGFDIAGDEASELANVPDLTGMDITLDGENMLLTADNHCDYLRTINLKTGLLTRSFTYVTKGGKRVKLCFRRFVSMKNLHLMAQEMTVTPVECDIKLSVKSGVNGQVTNEGTQHFDEKDRGIYDNRYMECKYTLTNARVDYVIHAAHTVSINGEEAQIEPTLGIPRRSAFAKYSTEIKSGDTFKIEKFGNVYTARDFDCKGLDEQALAEKGLIAIKSETKTGFEELYKQSADEWANVIWSKNDITLESENDFDQLSIRYGLYHMSCMTPAHDNRMNIAAKGLTGEGYKGHTYWDTEVFMLPLFVHTRPQAARALMEQRYLMLDAAHKKAQENGKEGAMYPWETAWITDGDVSAAYSGMDVHTHQKRRLWVGAIEIHVTADVAYGVYYYYKCTGDEDFMNRYGYEIIFDTAKFWQDRLEYNKDKNCYEINDVIGPDEYKIHVNNNAFTNYMAQWNIALAKEYYEKLKDTNPELLKQLEKKLSLKKVYKNWCEKAPLVYLPKANEQHILPQDDSFLDLDIIDLKPFKESTVNRLIYKYYDFEELRKIQVSKQADTVLLFFLMEGLFDFETKKKSYYYYEDKCLHDSSLSLCTYSIMASDLKEYETAYALYERACRIDLGTQLDSCDAGVHAASNAGIWQCVVNGFTGVRLVDGKLRIEPHIPKQWKKVTVPFIWRGANLTIEATVDALTVTTDKPITFVHNGNDYSVTDKTTINLKG